MGCARAAVAGTVAPEPAGRLAYVGAQPRRGGTLQLAVFQAGRDEGFARPCYAAVQLAGATLVTQAARQDLVQDRHEVKLLLPSPPALGDALRGGLFAYRLTEYGPAGLGPQDRCILAAHQHSSVLLRKLVLGAGLDLGRSLVVLNAHLPDLFFYDEFPRRLKAVGEAQYLEALDGNAAQYDRVLAVGPMWFLQATQRVARLHGKPCRGLYQLCCTQQRLDVLSNAGLYLDWLDLAGLRELDAADLDPVERAYQGSEEHLRLMARVAEAERRRDAGAQPYPARPESPRTNPASAHNMKGSGGSGQHKHRVLDVQQQIIRQQQLDHAARLRAFSFNEEPGDSGPPAGRSQSTFKQRTYRARSKAMSSLMDDDFQVAARASSPIRRFSGRAGSRTRSGSTAPVRVSSAERPEPPASGGASGSPGRPDEIADISSIAEMSTSTGMRTGPESELRPDVALDTPRDGPAADQSGLRLTGL